MTPARIALICVLAATLPVSIALSQSKDVGFRFVDDESNGVMRLLEDGKPVLSYRYGDQLAEGVPADRTRSSYLHPIYGLDGEQLTADFPNDHTHHRGLSWMWPRMKVGERAVELWHIKGIRDYFDKWIERSTDSKAAVLTVANKWKLDDGRKVADRKSVV